MHVSREVLQSRRDDGNLPIRRDVGLDRLRTAAILAVLFGHGGYFLFALLPHFDSFALAAWLGTDAFFALSGFLVMRQLLDAPPRNASDAGHYVRWRGWRVLGLFWFALLLHVVLAWAGARALPEHVWDYPLLLQNLAWPHPAFFGEAWSLPIFMLFSMLAPWIVLATRRAESSLRMLMLVLLGSLVAAVVARWLWMWQFEPVWDEGVRKLVVTRLDACLYGALAAAVWAASEPKEFIRKWAMGLGVILLVASAVAFLDLDRNVDDFARVGLFVASGAGFALLCLGLLSPAPNRRSHAANWLVRHGYALYLLNMPMLFVMALLGLGQTPDPMQALLRFGLWLLLCGAAAAAVHALIEAPLLAWRARRLSAATSATSR